MLPLQAGGGYYEEWLSGNIFEALAGPFLDVVGVPMAALLFFGGIGTAYYASSGKATMPVIMLILVGGATLAFAPPAATRFAITVLVLGLAAIGYLAWRTAQGGRV